MQLIRIDYELTIRYNDEDGDLLFTKLEQRSIRIILPQYSEPEMAEWYVDHTNGHLADPTYKRLKTTDEGQIDVILPSPQYRI